MKDELEVISRPAERASAEDDLPGNVILSPAGIRPGSVLMLDPARLHAGGGGLCGRHRDAPCVLDEHYFVVLSRRGSHVHLVPCFSHQLVDRAPVTRKFGRRGWASRSTFADPWQVWCAPVSAVVAAARLTEAAHAVRNGVDDEGLADLAALVAITTGRDSCVPICRRCAVPSAARVARAA